MTCPADLIVYDGTTPIMLARIEAMDASHDSVPIVQDDVSSITYTAKDITDGATTTASGTLTVADVIFDTLQTGDIWTKDSTGFNFLHKLPSSAINASEHWFQVTYTITLDDGTVQKWQYDLLSR